MFTNVITHHCAHFFAHSIHSTQYKGNIFCEYNSTVMLEILFIHKCMDFVLCKRN